jgi:class 3 adenylate cyclase
VEAFSLGANDYLTKPIDLPVAVSRIQTQVALKRTTEELEKKNLFIRSTLGRFLTDEVVDTLLDRPDLLEGGGEKRKVTVLMSDLRGFTSLSERLPAEQVVEVLNIYLEAMIAVIDQYGGVIDEIIGDAILVIFGAPTRQDDDAERAAACAIAMQRAMGSVNERLKASGFSPVAMGIGISTGEVVVGVIGSVDRSKYGIIGRQVNLTARVESCTAGGQILISEYTRDEIASILETGAESTVDMKGFDHPVLLVELLGIRGKYALSMPRKGESLRKLRTPIRIKFAVLEGKVSRSTVHSASFSRLSPTSAMIESDFIPAPFSNLRIQIADKESFHDSGDLYAKVADTSVEPGSFSVAFTDLPPDVEQELRKRYETGA